MMTDRAMSSGVLQAASLSEFEKLVEGTRRKAYNLAYRMTGNRDDAEDLTQEAYLRAYRSFDTYNRQLPFENWFFRILSNLSIDRIRRQPRQKMVSLDQPVGDGVDNLVAQIVDEGANPEYQLMLQITDERLQNALNAVPPIFRAAVLLRDVEGHSYQEIAHILRASVGTIRSRIHRGRVLLRRQMDAPPLASARKSGGNRRKARTVESLTHAAVRTM